MEFLSVLMGIFSILGGIIQTNTANQNAQELADKQLKSNEELSAKSLEQQKELAQMQMNLQEKENALTRLREDTAHQREVTDLEKAGLSAYATTGGASASPMTSGGQALGNLISAIGQNTAERMEAHEQHTARITDSMFNTIKQKGEYLGKMVDMAQLNLESEKAKYQNELTKAQTNTTIGEEERAKTSFEPMLMSINLDNREKILANALSELDLKLHPANQPDTNFKNWNKNRIDSMNAEFLTKIAQGNYTSEELNYKLGEKDYKVKWENAINVMKLDMDKRIADLTTTEKAHFIQDLERISKIQDITQKEEEYDRMMRKYNFDMKKEIWEMMYEAKGQNNKLWNSTTEFDRFWTKGQGTDYFGWTGTDWKPLMKHLEANYLTTDLTQAAKRYLNPTKPENRVDNKYKNKNTLSLEQQ